MKLNAKRVIGVEPTTFSLEGCGPDSQSADMTVGYQGPKKGCSDSVSDSSGPPLLTRNELQNVDPELLLLIHAWGSLPVSVRKGIMVIVEGIR